MLYILDYCTISIDLAVMCHRAPHGQRLLVDPKKGQKRLFKKIFTGVGYATLFSAYLFKGALAIECRTYSQLVSPGLGPKKKNWKASQIAFRTTTEWLY
jgi:hypothetical protein